MTLIYEKIGHNVARRCDARCYNGHGAKCTCVCGGKNHGAGLEKAIDNVRDVFMPAIDDEQLFAQVPEFVRDLAHLKPSARDRATQRALFQDAERARIAQGILFR